MNRNDKNISFNFGIFIYILLLILFFLNQKRQKQVKYKKCVVRTTIKYHDIFTIHITYAINCCFVFCSLFFKNDIMYHPPRK